MNGWVNGGNSPALRNPKKPRQQAVHCMTYSKLWVSKECWIICMRSAVTGWRCRRVEPRWHLMPWRIRWISNLVIYRTATPWPLLYSQNWIPLALQTIDDPTGKLPKQSERVLCRPVDKGICNGDHLPANQSLPKIALHPMEPAASQETWISGMGAQRGANRNLYLFHDWKNSSHHEKSKWNPLLNLIGWSCLWKAASRLIIRRRKVWLEGQLCMHVEDCQLRNPAPSVCNGVFVTRRPGVCGYEQIFLWESSFMPKTVRRVGGPSNLSGWKGIPQYWNYWIQVSTFRWRIREVGGPRVWKSSR